MTKITEDNYRIGDPKVMTNTKGAPQIDFREITGKVRIMPGGIVICLNSKQASTIVIFH